MYNDFKLVDGYALSTTNGSVYTTPWVDVRSYEAFSCSVVFTGGSPAGTVKLQQSNDRQNAGGNIVTTLFTANRNNSSGATAIVDDSKDVAAGNGAVTATVSAAGTSLLDQRLCPFGWFRVVFTSSAIASTQLDIFVTLKNYQ